MRRWGQWEGSRLWGTKGSHVITTDIRASLPPTSRANSRCSSEIVSNGKLQIKACSGSVRSNLTSKPWGSAWIFSTDIEQYP